MWHSSAENVHFRVHSWCIKGEYGSYHCSWNLWHFCSWGSWTWVELINKQAWKPVQLYKFHSFLKIFICLSWKTTNDVCSNCYSRHSVKEIERNT